MKPGCSIIGVQPAHHGLRVATRARGDMRRAALLRDLIKRQEALARAPVWRACRQPTQVFRRLTPAGMINEQHDGTAYLSTPECIPPILPASLPDTMGLKLDAV